MEYKLPDVTICGYDLDGNVQSATYEINYKYAEKRQSKFYGGDPFKYVSDEDDFNREEYTLNLERKLKSILKKVSVFPLASI